MTLPPWIVKAAWTLFILAALAFCLGPLYAAPQARSGAECSVIGNMVAVGGVFAKNGWSQADTLKLYPDLYGRLYTARPDDAHELARLAIAAAYLNRQKNPNDPPKVYGDLVDFMCNQLEGDLDEILGSGT